MNLKLAFLLTFGLTMAGIAPSADAGLEDLVVEPVIPDLENPVWVTTEPNGALSITLLPGIVLRHQAGNLDPVPVLDVQSRISVRGGLHSVAFHPTEPWLFIHFAESDSGDFVVSRFDLTGDPPRAQLASEVELIRSPKPSRVHYGGQLAFGPDGYLWISTGDASGQGDTDPQCEAQETSNFEGKILRLDVDTGSGAPPYFSIPSDNPYASGGGSPEVWAYGLRNPWRFSFDRETGDLWISDVGQGRREEANFLSAGTGAGTNFGWKVMEGTTCFSDLSGCSEDLPECGDAAYRPPTVEYARNGENCAIIGGFVYRGRLIPALHGRYLYGDFCSGEFWAFESGAGSEILPIQLTRANSFGEDAEGELWLTTIPDPPAVGQVYRLRDASLPAAGLVELDIRNIEANEGDGLIEVGVVRVGGTEGEMKVLVSATGITATAGIDFVAEPTEVAWGAGESGRQSLQITLIDDNLIEGIETFEVALALTAGGGILGARDRGTVSVADNEECTRDATHLCLNDSRFRASVSWETADGLEGEGQAVTLGEDSGSFWFFSANNPEIFIKILDACNLPGNRYWVFAAGLTDVRTTLRVVDTETGEERVYNRPLGVSYEAIRDTGAFSTCP